MELQQLAPSAFLIVHDPYSGKVLVSAELLACGIVAAQFGDLMLAGRLRMAGDRVEATDRPGTAGDDDDDDDIGTFVVDAVNRQSRSHTVRTWTKSLGDPLYELVARSLVEREVVRRESGRRLVRRGADRFPAADLLAANRPRVRLENMIRNPQQFDLAGALTVAIVGALGVDHTLAVQPERALVEEIHEHLPTAFASLMAGLRDAVSAVSLTVRR
jgi:hypothetical protein